MESTGRPCHRKGESRMAGSIIYMGPQELKYCFLVYLRNNYGKEHKGNNITDHELLRPQKYNYGPLIEHSFRKLAHAQRPCLVWNNEGTG